MDNPTVPPPETFQPYEWTKENPNGMKSPKVRGKARLKGYCLNREMYVATAPFPGHETAGELTRIGWRFERYDVNEKLAYYLHDGRQIRDDWLI